MDYFISEEYYPEQVRIVKKTCEKNPFGMGNYIDKV